MQDARSAAEAASVLAQDSLDEAEDSLLPGGGASAATKTAADADAAKSLGVAAVAPGEAAEIPLEAAANALPQTAAETAGR